MNLDPQEIQAIALALAPAVADILERRLSKRPEWAFSISEASAYAAVPEDAIRHAIKAKKLRTLKIGNNLRILRSDLFAARTGNREANDDA